jgi:hypothetical protein
MTPAKARDIAASIPTRHVSFRPTSPMVPAPMDHRRCNKCPAFGTNCLPSTFPPGVTCSAYLPYGHELGHGYLPWYDILDSVGVAFAIRHNGADGEPMAYVSTVGGLHVDIPHESDITAEQWLEIGQLLQRLQDILKGGSK